MSASTLPPEILPPGIAVAPALPDILPAPRARGRVGGAIHRHPTIVAGGILIGIMVFIAIFAPWLGTTDPTAIAPV